MITDPSHPLVRALEGTTEEVVYLPRKVQVTDGAEKAENNAARPGVIAAARAYFENPDALHGASVGDVTIQQERPVHRMMIWMSAQGASAQDIANHTGYSPATVRNVLKQPWARQRLIQILNESGRDAVKHFLTNEVAPSLETLREVRDSAASGAQARIAASNAILDRALGKPVARVETDNTNRTVPDDVVRLDAEIAAVRAELASKNAIPDGTN